MVVGWLRSWISKHKTTEFTLIAPANILFNTTTDVVALSLSRSHPLWPSRSAQWVVWVSFPASISKEAQISTQFSGFALWHFGSSRFVAFRFVSYRIVRSRNGFLPHKIGLVFPPTAQWHHPPVFSLPPSFDWQPFPRCHLFSQSLSKDPAWLQQPHSGHSTVFAAFGCAFYFSHILLLPKLPPLPQKYFKHLPPHRSPPQANLSPYPSPAFVSVLRRITVTLSFLLPHFPDTNARTRLKEKCERDSVVGRGVVWGGASGFGVENQAQTQTYLACGKLRPKPRPFLRLFTLLCSPPWNPEAAPSLLPHPSLHKLETSRKLWAKNVHCIYFCYSSADSSRSKLW